MKFTTFLALAFAVLSLAACGGGGEKALVRKWQLDPEPLIEQMKKDSDGKIKDLEAALAKAKAAGETEQADELEVSLATAKAASEQMTKRMTESMKDAIIEFKKGGEMVSSAAMSSNGKETTGKWELSKDAKKLTTTDFEGKKSELDVRELTAKKLVLEASEGVTQKTVLSFKPAS